MTIGDKLRELGYNGIDETFFANVDMWKSWYNGNVKGFHYYRIKNGEKTLNLSRYSLCAAKAVCEEWASLLMNEKVKITLEGDAEQQFVDNVFEENNFYVKINEMQEMKTALGTVAYIPRMVGVAQEGEIQAEKPEIKIDYVTAEHIRPLSWENGIVNECAFYRITYDGGKAYCYIQIHKKEDKTGEYVIENKLFSYENGNIGDEIQLNTVKTFGNIADIVHTGSTQRQFVIDRPNIVNNYDYQIPMGVPVYANAIDVLRGVDIAYDSYVNEFQLGKKRIMVKPTATEYRDGEAVFDPSDLVFYVLPEDLDDGAIITPIDMSLRVEEHKRGIQDMLNTLYSKCGLGESHYNADNRTLQTATQVVSENSTMFRAIKKHEIILEQAIIELCRIILRMGNTIDGVNLDENVEISIDFDDSVIEDKKSEFSTDLQLLNSGIMNDWEFRAKWMNEDPDTAKASLPRMEEMTTETQNEIE